MNYKSLRSLVRCLLVALSIHGIQDVFAQDAEVNVLTTSVPDQPGVDGAKPDSPTARRGPKSKYVPALPKVYEGLDKNRDGQIGLYEWDRTKYAEFFKLDKNGDGFLTAQELAPKAASSIAKMRIGDETAKPEKDALPNPGTLVAFHQKIGETISFSVTGQTKGSIRGNGMYTTDSDLATAAVHAGLLKDGETGVVRVTIIPSPPAFTASTTNGITSESWQQGSLAAFTIR